ncbi:glutamyl-tRNA amidotransferase [Synechococcales cyanobacterium C]|uniref:Glutamyl-tRNA amidotransferase n=2 Tax=Petrachloros TaxID=2918834 RepID=A0A8K2A0I0_9CYAN|nr:glutamyl-tRNA amidotransferase [Petrachloros mirabilis ULC683]
MPTETVCLAVNGTLMRGLALNANFLALGATFAAETVTAPIYRLWSIEEGYPAMQRVSQGGAAIALELWQLPVASLATLLEQEPPGLCVGKVHLANGEAVLGIVAEAITCEGQLDITPWGGWRAYIDAPALSPPAPSR